MGSKGWWGVQRLVGVSSPGGGGLGMVGFGV